MNNMISFLNNKMITQENLDRSNIIQKLSNQEIKNMIQKLSNQESKNIIQKLSNQESKNKVFQELPNSYENSSQSALSEENLQSKSSEYNIPQIILNNKCVPKNDSTYTNISMFIIAFFILAIFIVSAMIFY